MSDPNLPCGYCCNLPLCDSHDPEHDDLDCVECAATKLSDPHPECIESVNEYISMSREQP